MSDATKAFMTTFDSLTGAWNRYQIWQDFIWMTACGISNTIDTANRREREATYMNQAAKYNAAEMGKFADLFAQLAMIMDDHMASGDWGDFLGDLFMRLGLGNDAGGQFFTPYHLCHLTSRLVIDLDDVRRVIDQDGYCTFNEPACGAGAMMIAAAEHLSDNGIDYQRDCLFVAQDIDMTTALMCYIQLSLLGCAGYVRIGNTLENPPTGNGLFADAQADTWFMPMWFDAVWQIRRSTEAQRRVMRQLATRQTHPKNVIQGDGGQMMINLGG